MPSFIHHEIVKGNNDYTEIILYLDNSPNALEEFSTELGEKSSVANVENSAIQYVKKHLPNVNYKKIKVMIGGAVIASILGVTLVPASGGGLSAEEVTSPTGSAVGSVGVTGSPLAVSEFAIGGFSTVVLNGQTQNSFSDIDSFTVTDPSGTAAGWHINMSATQFENADGDTLPTGSLTVSAPSITALAESGSMPVDETIILSDGPIDGAGTTIISTPAGKGMGTYTVSFAEDALKLSLLPKDVRDGTYTSTITVSISTGP